MGFRVDSILRGMCFPLIVLDLGEPVLWFEEDHDVHEVTSGRRPRSCVGCDFKSVVVIAWSKANFVIVEFSMMGWVSSVG